ncbi:FUSC family protein [Caballeronia sp. dw_276]|uniref:FUSC family protein n=1 Tax=Caballeronia sp. dw_276 TaxID=2719795 RepID=UPI001BD25734|nr:FUSC family protein [Caballeronia sp. dw_276]
MSIASIAQIFHRAQRHRFAAGASHAFSTPVPSSRLLSSLLGSDPGSLRLHTALRSALACLLTGFVTIGWTVATHQPPTLAAFALLLAMIAPLFLRDARWRGWLASLAAIYGAGCVSFVAASALAAWPLVADAAFLAVLFTGMLVQACGPRALGSAMTAVVAFYLGLYLHPSFLHVCMTLGLSMAGVGIVVLTGRVLVPTRARATLERALGTVAQRAALVLADRRADEAQAIAHLSSLNEAALAVEEQLDLLDFSGAQRLRARLIDVEVSASVHAREGALSDQTGDRLRIALRRLARAGRDAASSTMRATVTKTSVASWRGLLSWLPASRATTAALIAMLIGHSVSPERWFWAVITTFVVFLGTRSRGDTIRKTGERVLGTLAGVAVSAMLVATLHGMPAFIVAAMIVCVFGWAYFILTSYGQGVFFITVLVGLIYGELGFAIGPLVEMRVEEVFVGCAVSVAVAVLMMPLRTSHHIEAKVEGVLAALDEIKRISETSFDAHASMASMRMLDRRWHELQVALRPLRTQRVFAWNTQVELAIGPLFACVQTARELTGMTARGANQTTAFSETRARLAGAMSLFALRSGRAAAPSMSHETGSSELAAAR